MAQKLTVKAQEKLGSAYSASLARIRKMKDEGKAEVPIAAATTMAGGYSVPYFERNNPFQAYEWGSKPEMLIGGALVGYAIFSKKSGMLEKRAADLGSGMLAVTAYKYSREEGKK